MPIAEGIAALKASLELAKITSDLVNRPNMDANAVRSNLQEMLIHSVSALTALGEAQQEIFALRAQLNDKTALAALTADLEPVPDGGFLVKNSEKGAGHFIPYCPVCWGEHEKAIALVPMANGYYSCANHKNASYKTQAYREAEEKRRQERIADANAVSVIRPRGGGQGWMG